MKSLKQKTIIRSIHLLPIVTLFFSLLVISSHSEAQTTLVDLSSRFSLSTANERSVLDKRTMKTTSTADVTLTNISNQPVLTPLHGVITINNATGPVTMPEALVGPASAPYNKRYYYDLTSKLSGGQLAPGGRVTFSVKFVRASTVTFRYNVTPYGVLPPANQAPVVNAGPPQTITLPATAALSGAVTDDGLPSGSTLTIIWSKISGPGSVTFGNPSIAITTAAFSQAGTYVLRLTASDSQLYATSEVTITVNPAPNQLPVADAGKNRTVSLLPGQSAIDVQLDGSGSRDPDGTVASYSWFGIPTPSTTISPTVSLPAGTHTFSLYVTDNLGARSPTVEVTITVISAQRPSLTVRPLSYSVKQGESLTISVSADHPDGRPIALSAGPSIKNGTFSTTSGTHANGTYVFRPDKSQLGRYALTFAANDTLGLKDAKTVQITVTKTNDPPVFTMQTTASVLEGATLAIPLQATDPDGDILTLTVSGLPTNAVFVPATGMITFIPGYDQAGTYSITVTASDGQLSASKTVQVTVIDVPTGEPGQATELVLDVDPVESPTFLTKQRITGSVNMPGGTPEIERPKSALIVGMSPVMGEQGRTMNVILTGSTSGGFATHFAPNVSKASFGAGITVNSLVVSSSNQEITANITIAPSAAIGVRSVMVTTGGETAVGSIAFNVLKGTTAVSGVLRDPDTGQGIGNALVTVQGTIITAVTGAEGTFTLPEVPSGAQTLVVTALNRELLILPVTTQVGQNTDVGELRSKSTVFDPSAPPSISVLSVVGRGATRLSFNMDRADMRRLVADALLLVGGSDAGVLDEYGVQTNPSVNGYGLLSLTAKGRDSLADKMLLGETYSLPHLLQGASFAFQWGGSGRPLTLQEWIAGLQDTVDQAWGNPTDPSSYLPVLIFNSGNTLAPAPPRISFLTRLNALQAFLLNTSLLAYMQERTTP